MLHHLYAAVDGLNLTLEQRGDSITYKKCFRMVGNKKVIVETCLDLHPVAFSSNAKLMYQARMTRMLQSWEYVLVET